MIDYKINFYLKKLISALPNQTKDKFIPVLKEAFYARIFKKEKTLLVQKKEIVKGKYTCNLYAYSLKDASFKFKVEIPRNYFLVYCLEVGRERSMGMVCKPIDTNDYYAVEYSIESNGRIRKVRNRLCTENIDKANRFNDNLKDCIYPVTELKTDKENNEVYWKYNGNHISITTKEHIVYAIYHDFEEIILLLTADSVGNRSVYLYNLDGSIKFKLEFPEGFMVSYCPTQIFEYNRTVLSIICHNPEISISNELRYIVIPDNGDLVYIGIQR